MARFYTNEIKKIQPHGPYRLGGQSLGGAVAFEITHQLHEEKESIDSLFLIESWANIPNTFKNKDTFNEIMWKQHNRLKQQLAKKNIAFPDEPWVELQWKRMTMLYKYNPPTINQDLILFKAQNLNVEYYPINDDFNHWEKHTFKNIKKHMVKGNHETILSKNNVSSISRIINFKLLS
jgi:thioesterase domain-containing protein